MKRTCTLPSTGSTSALVTRYDCLSELTLWLLPSGDSLTTTAVVPSFGYSGADRFSRMYAVPLGGLLVQLDETVMPVAELAVTVRVCPLTVAVKPIHSLTVHALLLSVRVLAP